MSYVCLLLFTTCNAWMLMTQLKNKSYKISIFQWSQENMLSFNITKCKCMLLTKKRNTSPATIFLNNQPLEYVCHYKYLGVILASNLSWSNHIQEICNKTRRVLGMIYHRISKNIDDPSTILKLYTALVHPHLEYAAQVWNPYQEKDSA